MKQIADALGCSIGTVFRCFRRYELARRSAHERTPFAAENRLYRLENASAFDEINAPDKAYWLGFLWADGFTRAGQKRAALRVVLRFRDVEHLVSFNGFLKSDARITTRMAGASRQYAQVCLVVNSRRLTDRLVELDLVAHRTRGDLLLAKIPQQWRLDFCRGLFDGDGHIQRQTISNFFLSGWEVGLSGTEYTVEAFRQTMRENAAAVPKITYNGTGNLLNKKAVASGPRGIQILEVLYERPGPALAYKRDIALLLTTYLRRAFALGLFVEARGDGVRFIHTERAAWLQSEFEHALSLSSCSHDATKFGFSFP